MQARKAAQTQETEKLLCASSAPGAGHSRNTAHSFRVTRRENIFARTYRADHGRRVRHWPRHRAAAEQIGLALCPGRCRCGSPGSPARRVGSDLSAATAASHRRPDRRRTNRAPCGLDSTTRRVDQQRRHVGRRHRCSVRQHNRRGCIPLGRMAEPEDMAAALCFLAGSGARILSGRLPVLDDGSSVYGGSEALPPARYAVQPSTWRWACIASRSIAPPGAPRWTPGNHPARHALARPARHTPARSTGRPWSQPAVARSKPYWKRRGAFATDMMPMPAIGERQVQSRRVGVHPEEIGNLRKDGLMGRE